MASFIPFEDDVNSNENLYVSQINKKGSTKAKNSQAAARNNV